MNKKKKREIKISLTFWTCCTLQSFINAPKGFKEKNNVHSFRYNRLLTIKKMNITQADASKCQTIVS